MLARRLRGSLVCALIAAAACMVEETPDDALSADTADGAETDMAGVVPPPSDVACTVARTDTTLDHPDTAGGEITTEYARFIYPAGAYNGDQPIHIRPDPNRNGVQIAPPPAEPSQLWLNYAMCPGDGNPVYYFHIGSEHHPARKLDATWVAHVVVRGDLMAPVSEASLVPSLQIVTDTSAIRGGFVIVSN
ncbi:MAG: hypothetical protein ACREKM_08280 [Longimicrobiales bacterium]